ncbi:unnamed protein product [Chironomus riparius]|uniref:Ionotropic glutamate receptor C-terminal domain-containing protein n=1 Tax=Chironomus riparius TaxID=315576 RepID=A0A9N9RMX2_9DIPT|nr:unnamed protein product [Chironomus riparius]
MAIMWNIQGRKLFEVARDLKKPIFFVAVIPSLTFDMLKLWRFPIYYSEMPVQGASVLQYTFFITNEADTVTLSTVEWYSPYGCNRPHFIKLNSFNKETQKWNKKLQNYEKFLEYHNCELVMMIPIQDIDRTIQYTSGYAYIENLFGESQYTIYGITPVIFNIASKLHNFSVYFQLVIMEPNWIKSIQNDVRVFKVNGIVKSPNVFFQISPLAEFTHHITVTKVVANLDVLMYVTPSEKYTAYEKFILPFDLYTWILIFVTFLMTFVTIFIINRLSKSTQNLVYGHAIETPIWNVISIFFGISQTQLPNKNFSRFILMIFIYFCLIFRTCFQSKFFEFMTSEPRRPPPKTFSDLIDRNYNVYAIKSLTQVTEGSNGFERWPNITTLSSVDYFEAFMTQSQNSTARMALSVDEFYINFYLKLKIQPDQKWIKLDTVVASAYDAFIFIGPVFYFRMFNKIIDDLIPTGVMNHLIEKYYTKKFRIVHIDDKIPKVFTFDDLSFGFYIWLGFCLISFIGFIAEHIYMLFKPKKRINAKVHAELKDSTEPVVKLSPELIEKFRIKNYLQNDESGISTESLADT